MSRIFVNPNTFDQRTVYSPRGNHPTLAQAIKALAGTDANDLPAVNANLAAVQRAVKAQNEEQEAIKAGYTRELTKEAAASSKPKATATRKSSKTS